MTAAQRSKIRLDRRHAHLLRCIRVAADSAAAGRGAMLVVNEKIHPAREVTKRIIVRRGNLGLG